MNSGVQETKKLDNQLKAPVRHHISSSVSGIVTIRSFRKQEVFKKRFNEYLNTSNSADSMYRLATRWFMWRMEMLALVTVILTATVCVALKGSVSPAVAGLALSNVFISATFIAFVMKFKAQFKASVTCLDRVLEYLDLAQEAPAVVETSRPSEDWPRLGEIQLRGVSLRYRPELPLVLHNLTVTVTAGQKVGIVGRTGAGKSSIISALLRLVELETGKIIIDGVDVRFVLSNSSSS